MVMPAFRHDRPWEALALTAALPEDRELLAMLLEFDGRLEQIIATSSEAMLGQIRLAWWRDTLNSSHPPAGEPLIARFTAISQDAGWSLTEPMLRLLEGWEYRLLDPADHDAFGKARGEGLFRAFAGPGAAPGLDEAAKSWALAGFGGDADCCPPDAVLRSWPRRLRPLSLLALAGRAQGRLAGVRLSWHGLTGR